MNRTTHTYAVLELSDSAYCEIATKLSAAGYDHAFHDGVIDMHGIAVSSKPELQGPPEEIGTGLYRLVDGEIAGREPENPEM